jgi:hypothetical protein
MGPRTTVWIKRVTGTGPAMADEVGLGVHVSDVCPSGGRLDCGYICVWRGFRSGRSIYTGNYVSYLSKDSEFQE